MFSMIQRYSGLSQRDPQTFCDSLIEWCSAAQGKNIIMFFDVAVLEGIISTCKNESDLQGIPVEELPSRVKRLRIRHLEIRWLNPAGQLSLLYEVVDTSTGTSLYHAPNTFEGSILCYGFKL